jgi:hypothetical protein
MSQVSGSSTSDRYNLFMSVFIFFLFTLTKRFRNATCFRLHLIGNGDYLEHVHEFRPYIVSTQAFWLLFTLGL